MEPTKAPWLAPGNTAEASATGRPLGSAAGATRSATNFVTNRPAFPAKLNTTEQHQFCSPRKHLTSQAELASFLASAAAKEFVGFVLALNESVKGRRVSDACSESPTVKGLLALLAELSAWVDLIPPVTTSLRYGNPAFREWHTRLESQARQKV
ncbi:hypothetical protein WJX84_008172 [Apatococcus fuscideae]|uniref:Serine/threonine-protein phosphatase 2A activator n=1 Tax=Apatococcus fuscideae TaxID=2026836 RepID=A0AAW1T0T4_9CHLO